MKRVNKLSIFGLLCLFLFFCRMNAAAETFTSTQSFDASQAVSWNYSWVQEVPGLPANADVESVRIDLRAQVWYWGMYPGRLDLLCSDSTTFAINDDAYRVCQLTPSTHPSPSQFYTISCELTPGQMNWLSDDGRLNLMMATSFNGTFYLDSSEITVETAGRKVAQPVLSPPPGVYFSDQPVTLSCATDGAWIAYTLDGSDPTEASMRYAGAISVTERATIKARGFKGGYDPSDITAGLYAVQKGPERRLFLRDGGILSPVRGDPVPWITRYVHPEGDSAAAVWESELRGDLSGVYRYQLDIVENPAPATLHIEWIAETADGDEQAASREIDIDALPEGTYLPLGENLLGPDLTTADGDRLKVRISLTAGSEAVGIGIDGAEEYNDSSIAVYYGGPAACFSLSATDPGNDRVYGFDASCSADPANSDPLLQYRWDWENDGKYDTPFTADPMAEHEFPTRGVKTVKLQVKNPADERTAITETASIPLPFTDVFLTPGKAPSGLAWDGFYLWHSDGASRTLYQSTLSGEVVHSFPSPCGNPLDLAWDGHHLWIIDAWGEDDKGNILYRVDVDGNVLNTIQLPSDISTGLTWDGHFLWGADGTNRRIVKIDPDTGGIIHSFTSPGTGPRGLAWDGRHLWNADHDTGRIYKLDSSGRVLNVFEAPGSAPMGLTWDGSNLWCIDLNSYTAYFKPLGRIQVYPTGLTIGEPEGAATVKVRLEQRPAGPVTLTLRTTNPAEIETPERVVLDGNNWRTGVDIPVTVRMIPIPTASGGAPWSSIRPAAKIHIFMVLIRPMWGWWWRTTTSCRWRFFRSRPLSAPSTATCRSALSGVGLRRIWRPLSYIRMKTETLWMRSTSPQWT
jgi:sugar lactone lactonase YvrE